MTLLSRLGSLVLDSTRIRTLTNLAVADHVRPAAHDSVVPKLVSIAKREQYVVLGSGHAQQQIRRTSGETSSKLA